MQQIISKNNFLISSFYNNEEETSSYTFTLYLKNGDVQWNNFKWSGTPNALS